VERVPRLELVVDAFAGPQRSFLRLRLVLAPVQDDHLLSGLVVSVVALAIQGDEPGFFKCGEDIPDPGGCGGMRAAG
jgi:hypothetical protein